jgi:hypothetical protein
MAAAQRVEVGFEGGQVISIRLKEAELQKLRAELGAGSAGWHDLETEEGALAVDLGKIAFLRVDSGEHRVGFIFGE